MEEHYVFLYFRKRMKNAETSIFNLNGTSIEVKLKYTR